MIIDQNMRDVLKLFRQQNGLRLLAGATLSLATVIFGIALLGLSGWFISATAIAGVTIATALAFDIFAPSAGIRFFALGRTACRYGERLITHDGTFAVLARLREQLFRGWTQRLAANSLTKYPSRLLFRLTLDIDALDSLFLRVIVPLFSALGAALFTSVALGMIDIWLGTACGLILLTSGLGIPLLAARRARQGAKQRAHALEVLRARTIDLVRGQTELLMVNRLDAQIAAASHADQRLSEADLELNATEQNSSFAFTIVGSLLLAGILLAVASLAQDGSINTPLATFALLVGLAAVEPFTALRRGSVEMGRILLAVRRIGPHLRETPANHATAITAPGDLSASFSNVSLCYEGASQPSLRNVSFEVKTGERIAIIGPSGAGKSSILALIAGEQLPTNGAVLNDKATLLTQQTQLFNATLRSNLTLACPGANDTTLINALHVVGLADFVESLPSGLDTQLGEGGKGLSGGQSRRLALARMLLRDTPVWLFDEPTEGLDRQTAYAVLESTYPLARDHTIIFATHLKREAAIADRLLIMKVGRIMSEARRGSLAFDQAISTLRPD